MTEETKAFARQVLALIDAEKDNADAWNDGECGPMAADKSAEAWERAA